MIWKHLYKNKIFKAFIGFFVVAVFLAAQVDAATRAFKLSVYKAENEQELSDSQRATRLTDDVYYWVFQYSSTTKSSTRETIYSDKSGTTIPMDPWVDEATYDNTGDIRFYCDPTESGDAQVYLHVVDAANGFSWSGPVQYNKHKTIIIDERSGIQHMLTIPFWSDTSIATGIEVDTGVNMHPGSLIHDAHVVVHIASYAGTTGGSLDVGFLKSEGSTTGADFIASQDISSTLWYHDDVFDTAMQHVSEDGTYRSVSYTQYSSATGGQEASGDGLINILFTPW